MLGYADSRHLKISLPDFLIVIFVLSKKFDLIISNLYVFCYNDISNTCNVDLEHGYDNLVRDFNHQSISLFFVEDNVFFESFCFWRIFIVIEFSNHCSWVELVFSFELEQSF